MMESFAGSGMGARAGFKWVEVTMESFQKMHKTNRQNGKGVHITFARADEARQTDGDAFVLV
jgi:hypothetical protein